MKLSRQHQLQLTIVNKQMTFDPSIYNDDFFKWHYDNVHKQCVEVGREFAEKQKIHSLIDFGCGIGSYLYGANLHCDIRGLELSENAKGHTPKEITNRITYGVDLAKEINIKSTKLAPFQASLCIEVAEHIDPEGSDTLIKNITSLTGEMCVFTAAPPGQEGSGHINCQEQWFWINLFRKYGFLESKRTLESFKKAPDYVQKNLMIFEKI